MGRGRLYPAALPVITPTNIFNRSVSVVKNSGMGSVSVFDLFLNIVKGG